MALSDYYDRLTNITNTGTRATQFDTMKSQRAKAAQDFIKQLNLQRQRQVQFNVRTDPNQLLANQQGAGGMQGAVPPNGQFQYPLHGNLRMTSGYGVHRAGHSSAHTGIDWGAPSGTPIYAPGTGTIMSALFDKIYGNQTIMDLGGGKKAMFGHQSKFSVKPGQHVNAGQVIGYVGSTGWSTGPHLHFQTWQNNQVVNPLSWFG